MNILVIMGRYPPDHSGGGLRIQRTYEDLERRHGARFAVIAEPIRGEKPVKDFPHVTRIPSAQPTPLLFYKLLKILAPAKKEYDLVHCIGPTRMTVMAALICRMLNIPYVTELSIDYDEKKARRARLLMNAFFKPRRAIALSPRIFNLYRAFGLPPEKIFLRPNPVMLGETASPEKDAPLHARIDALPGTHKHLMLARICTRKNQVAALALLENLPKDHTLILAGPLAQDEDPAYYKRLAKEITKRGLGNRIALWPESVAAPAALYQKCASFWCLSESEGLPNVVLEALWMGKPCFVNGALGLGNWIITPANGAELNLAASASDAAALILKDDYDSAAIQSEARSAFAPQRINDQTWEVLQAAAATSAS